MYPRQALSPLGTLYMLSSLALSLLVFSKSLNPYSISYSFRQTVLDFELWRPFTGMLYFCRVSLLLPLHLLFGCVALKKWNQRFGQDKAALLWIFVLSAISLAAFSTFVGLYFYANSFVMVLLMIWAIQHPNDFLQLRSFHLNSIYFPLIYASVMISLGSSFKNYVAGFLIGMLLGIIRNPTFVAQHGDLFPIPHFLKASFSQPGNQDVPLPEEPERLRISQQRRGDYFAGVGYQIG